MKLFAFIIIVVLVDFFCSSEAWWLVRRSRRRRCHPPSTIHGGWIHHWGESFIFTCPEGKAMTDMHSIYSTCKGDRVFRFDCGTNNATRYREKCHWSHWVNDFRQLVSFKCPYSGFLTGIRSRYRGNRKINDRRFKFRCCSNQLYHQDHCTTGSHFVNDWKQPMRFGTPLRYFLVGVTNYYDKRKRDRRWKFEYCKVKKY